MDYYELLPNVYRLQAGVGSDGEIFGGILLKDDPCVVIGASGGMKFVKNLQTILSDLDISGPIRLYFPSVTFNEIYTAGLVKKSIPAITIYVHESILQEVKHPESNFGENRYFLDQNDRKFLQKQLPKEIPDVLGYSKAGSFETKNTKLLFIPFSGPHIGHSLIYSRDHKLLCAGLLFGRSGTTSNYYLDRSGSIFQFENGLSFVEKARSDVIFPSYDEPEFTSDLKYKAQDMKETLKLDKERILDICSLKPKSLQTITSEFVRLYGEKQNSPPYDRIDINLTRVDRHLEQLVKDKSVIQSEGKYILKK